MKVTEEMITEQICTYLSFTRGQLNRIAPSGFFKNGVMRKHKSKFIKKGVSDILYLSSGTFYAFEVKTPGEYKYILKHLEKIRATIPSQLNEKQLHIWEQEEYLQGIRVNGGVGSFVCSLGQVRTILGISSKVS